MDSKDIFKIFIHFWFTNGARWATRPRSSVPFGTQMMIQALSHGTCGACGQALHKRRRQICSLRSWCGTANTGEAMKKTICWEGQPEPRVAIYGNWQISILRDWDKKKSSWSPLRLTFISVHLFSSKTFQDAVFSYHTLQFLCIIYGRKTAQVFAMHPWISLSPWHGRHNLWRKSAHRTWRNNHDRNSGVGGGYDNSAGHRSCYLPATP